MKAGTEKISEKKIALLVTSLSAFITPFMSSAINIGLPSIGKEFALNAVLLSWIATSYLLSAAVFLVPFGKIADIYGRKKVYLLGILFYSAASLLCGISFSAPALIIFRVIQGIGSAMVFGTGIAILTSVYPPGERGRAIGINIATTYSGLSLGPFLGGLLTQHFGWRSIFISNVPIGILIIAAIMLYMKGEWAEAKEEKFDIAGALLYSASLICLMYGFTLVPDLRGYIFVLSGISGFFFFLLWERKIPGPVLNVLVFRHNTVFIFSNLAALINYSATFAVGFLLSLYLQYIKGLSPQSAGTILVAQPVVMALVSPLAGRLSDRLEPRIIATIGMSLTTLGLMVFCFLSETFPVYLIIAGLIILGLGFGLFSSPNTNAVMNSVEKKYYGVGSAMLGTMRLTGQMFSMAISILIFSLFIGNVKITPENYPGFLLSIKAAFTVFTLLCTFGIAASFSRGRLR